MDVQRTYTPEKIFAGVKEILADALCVDEEEVTPTARIYGDFGAEWLDIVDVTFRLEREFGIKIPRGELFPESVLHGDPEFVQDGLVTEKGMEELRHQLTFVDLGTFEKDPHVSNIRNLFTVELICKYVEAKLGMR